MQLVGLIPPRPRFYGSAGVFIFCTRRRPAAATDYPFAVLSRHCVISVCCVCTVRAPSMAWVPGLCSYFWPGRSKVWGADHLFLQPWQGTLSRKGTLCSTWKKLMCSRRPLSSPSPRMSFPCPIIALLILNYSFQFLLRRGAEYGEQLPPKYRLTVICFFTNKTTQDAAKVFGMMRTSVSNVQLLKNKRGVVKKSPFSLFQNEEIPQTCSSRHQSPSSQHPARFEDSPKKKG